MSIVRVRNTSDIGWIPSLIIPSTTFKITRKLLLEYGTLQEFKLYRVLKVVK
jgi:hypothetical protein